MKKIEFEERSLLQEGFVEKSQTRPLSTTSSQNQTKTESASADFWQAIKTVIALQNQAPPLKPISRNGDLPLSFSQERLWLLNQLKPDSSAHNIPIALHITGPLNVPALEQTLNEILRRHETLRTTFAAVDGQPVQLIHPLQEFKLPILDFTTIQNPFGLLPCPEVNSGHQQPKSKIQNFVLEEAHRPFNISQEPLLRASLLQLAEEEYVLSLTIHQIVFDGWSEGALLRELGVLYEAFSTGKPSPLPELPIQYADFAVWQRQSLQGEFLDALLSYWKQQFDDGLPAQQLPTDRPQPVVQTRRSAQQTLVLPKTLSAGLKALSRQEGATLFATLLTAFKVLLYRYTAQEDLFVSTPTANRNRSQTKGLIGYFVNLLVLRSDLSGNPSFQELLGRVRQGVSGAFAHQDLPVLQLVKSLNLVNVPLSQVMFVLQNVPKQPLKLPGVTVEPLEVSNGTADFDLSLSMVEGAEELTGVLKYNTDLFEDATITQMLGDFQSLLEAIAANPEQPIASLLPHVVARPVVAAADRERSRPEREFVAPRNLLELQLTEIWQEVLGIKSIGVKDNFFELGGHSLLAVTLFNKIEEKFGKNLPLATLFQAATVEQLARVLSQENESEAWPSLIPIQPNGSKPPLFCVHGILGNVLIFREFAKHLPPDQPFYALQAQGLDGKEPPFTKVEEMAAYYIKEIRTVQPEGPYFLGGYSFGGLVAFEMAQQLQAQGQKVELLAFFDTVPMGYRQQGQLHDWVLQHLKKVLQYGPNYILDLVKWKIRQRLGIADWTGEYGIKETLLKLVQEKVFKVAHKSHPEVEQPISPDAPRPLEAIHLELVRPYIPRVYQGRVAYFRAMEVSEADKWYVDPLLGWRKLIAGGLEIQDIPGNHTTMFSEPNVETLVERLRGCLEKAQETLNR
jgi:thioesterase domain-containing protein/acyl carrier protein